MVTTVAALQGGDKNEGVKKMSKASLSEFMQAYAEGDLDSLVHDQETVNEGLAQIARELFVIGQDLETLLPAVERANALRAKARLYADMKSALQSIQRTLREV